MLMRELLNEAYHYVTIQRLQSDPIENRFSQYRQMSGGSGSLIANTYWEGIDIWSPKKEDDAEDMLNFISFLEEHEDNIIDA